MLLKKTGAARVTMAAALFLTAASPLAALQILQSYTDLYDSPPAAGTWLQASDGNLYSSGYKFTLTTKTLTSFPLPASTNVGFAPPRNFIQGIDTAFYAWNGSTVTRVTLAGVAATFATLAALQVTTINGLVQAADGSFYGAAAGGTNGNGMVFKIAANGTASILHTFVGGAAGTSPDNVIQASDGYLYGMANGGAQMFRLSTTGAYDLLANGIQGPADIAEGPGQLFYGLSGESYVSVDFSGNVTVIYTGEPPFQPDYEYPCTMGANAVLYCLQWDYQDYQSNSLDGVVGFAPGDGVTGGFIFTPNFTNGLSHLSDTLAGDGSFYGYYTYLGDIEPYPETTDSSLIYQEPAASGIASAPISIGVIPSTILTGGSATLGWQVDNAYSDTMQNCFASNAWSGAKATSGTVSVSPSSVGLYTYALTCGGIETGFATLNVGPELTLTATSHNFGSVAAGNSATYGIKLTNVTRQTFPFSISLSGPAGFTQVNNCGSSVAASASCEIIFTYKAGPVLGTQQAVFKVSANGAVFSPSNTGTLTATSVPAGQITTSTLKHNFGAATLNTSQTFGWGIQNGTGLAVPITLTASGDSSQYSITSNSCGTTLAVGANCQILFTFKPNNTSWSSFTATLTAPQTVTVSPGGQLSLIGYGH